jgi:hypothetical protein
MRTLTLAAVGLPLLLSACSGESAADPGDDDGGLPDGGTEAALDGGPCEPLGSWTWTFQAEAGAPRVDHVTVTAAPDAGAGEVEVTFVDRQVAVDQCMPGDGGSDAGPEPIAATGTLDAQSCTLKVGYSQSWCMSGEQQHESWDITLTLAGQAGQGTATEVSGWTMQKYTTDYAVTAKKD